MNVTLVAVTYLLNNLKSGWTVPVSCARNVLFGHPSTAKQSWECVKIFSLHVIMNFSSPSEVFHQTPWPRKKYENKIIKILLTNLCRNKVKENNQNLQN